MILAACSRGVVEQWELPVESVRVRPSDCSFLITVTGKKPPRDFYIQRPNNDAGYRPGVLLETDIPWETRHIEYRNRTIDIGRSTESTGEEYLITLERSIPPDKNPYDTPPRVGLDCLTLPNGAGRFVDATTIPTLKEFVPTKVSRWTTLKYMKIREGHHEPP